MKITLTVFTCVLAVVVLFVAFSVNAYKEDAGTEQSQEIVKSVSVNDINLGGMTKDDAKSALEEYASATLNRVLTVKIGSKTYKKTYEDLGYEFSINDTVQEAYSYGRSGNKIEDAKDIYGLNENNINLSKNINKNKTLAFVKELKSNVDKKTVNAKIYKSGTGLAVTSSAKGYVLDQEYACNTILNAINNQKTEVYLNIQTEMPDYSSESLSKINKKLSSFTTKFNPEKKERSTNLAVACKKINGTVLMPGDVFSFNDVVGPRNAKNGFKNAIIFNNGQEEEGMGGGICQVSSTIFNTALLGGFKINSRRCHSLKVAYVPIGRDAMVSYGSSDFKFTNNTKNAVVIFAGISGNTLTAEIWGNTNAYKKCKVETSVSPDRFSASLVRYVYDGAGNRTADYKTSSKYQKPKPKPEQEKKPQTS